MTDAFAEIDRAAAEQPARARRPWTEHEREIALYRPGEITLKTRLAILNATNNAANPVREPRTLAALKKFISTATQTEGNEQ